MERTIEAVTTPKKLHPHKVALWVAMSSITMMFAGLTSGYMVREAQGNWRYYKMPAPFYISTAVIILSSITFMLGLKAFKSRLIPRYRVLILSTIILGVTFGLLQYYGFYQLYHQVQQVSINGHQLNEYSPVKVNGNPSESFLFVIAGLHLLHIIGGIVALIVVYFRSFSTKIKVYNATGLEIVGGYWHFVDALWIYLFVFFLVNQ
ncbi:MAG: cytochrome c oxidase subunit 3 [Taibaiella sp.]|nr:cytochrome c oxidase subunit 3 [Taibaiella sp.]